MKPGKEIWKPIPGIFSDRYSVSNLGRAKSEKNSGVRILKSCCGSNGYPKLTLCIDNTMYNFSVHVLVAELFIGDRPSGCDINHINGIKTDNKVSNLEYVTRKENIQHSHMLGLQTQFGEGHHLSKISETDVVKIREAAKRGETMTKIGANFSISRTAATLVVKRKTWKHIK